MQMYAIRSLTIEDADAFVLLRRTMLNDAPWAFASSPQIDRGCNAKLVRESVTRPGSAILGAFDGNTLIGAAGLVRDEKPKRQHIATIWGVYVTAAARQQGVGRRLVETAITTAGSWVGVESVQLTVSERATTALRLYESLGFRVWGHEPDALRVDGERLTETHMRLEISRRP